MDNFLNKADNNEEDDDSSYFDPNTGEIGQPETQEQEPENEDDEAKADEEHFKSRGYAPIPDISPEEIKKLREYTVPYENSKKVSNLLTSSPHHNPVKAAAGDKVEAIHHHAGDYRQSLDSLMSSPEYKKMPPHQQEKAEHDFENKWHSDNPEHLENLMREVHGAHGKNITYKQAHRERVMDEIAHGLGGGNVGQYSAEAARQHLGMGGDEDEAPSMNVQQDKLADAFKSPEMREAAKQKAMKLTNPQGRGQHKLQPLTDEERTDLEYKAERDPSKIKEIASSHPILQSKEHRDKFSEHFQRYAPIMDRAVSSALGSLGFSRVSHPFDEGDFHEPVERGFLDAVNKYNPEFESTTGRKGSSFKNFLRQRVKHAVQTHLGSLKGYTGAVGALKKQPISEVKPGTPQAEGQAVSPPTSKPAAPVRTFSAEEKAALQAKMDLNKPKVSSAKTAITSSLHPQKDLIAQRHAEIIGKKGGTNGNQ